MLLSLQGVHKKAITHLLRCLETITGGVAIKLICKEMIMKQKTK
jgi:hypothetical protein